MCGAVPLGLQEDCRSGRDFSCLGPDRIVAGTHHDRQLFAPTASAAVITCTSTNVRRMGQRLRQRERMRVPSPAARTMARHVLRDIGISFAPLHLERIPSPTQPSGGRLRRRPSPGTGKKQNFLDLLMFSMICPSRSLWDRTGATQIEFQPVTEPPPQPQATFFVLRLGRGCCCWLTALAVTTQTKSATERLRSIFAAAEPASRDASRVTELQFETRILIAQIRVLTADRDRLAGPIALLESSIDDMTGAIKRQADLTAAALAANPRRRHRRPPFPRRYGPHPRRSQRKAQPAAPPSSSEVANVTRPCSPRRRLANSRRSPGALVGFNGGRTRCTSRKTGEFALDLGGGPTLDAIRQRWVTVKANFGPLLSGMHRSAREHRTGSTGYRLVVGPLPNRPAATGLCAHFNAAPPPAMRPI